MSTGILLPALYLPNISYLQAIKNNDGPIVVEQFENFPKQTFRTRTQIATANGVLDLLVPIQHGKKQRQVMKDVLINYDHPWQRLHWLSLQTAYRSSAYFEFYEDDFRGFYEKEYSHLLEFHVDQLKLILKLLKINREILLSEKYEVESPNEIDYRKAIHPKMPSLLQQQKPYYQLFEDKNGFRPELSIIDLLFSQGPQSKNYF